MTQQVIKFESLDSTNNYVAKALEKDTYSENDVILAGFQTAGRGQRGNKWQSEFNKNLTFTFAFRCDFLHIEEQFIISKAVSVAIANYLEEKLRMPITLKWPNDVLIEKQKICGMLLETKLVAGNRYIVVGIGLNVNQTSFDLEYPATSLCLELGRSMNLDQELEALMEHINAWIKMVKDREFAQIEDFYQSRLLGTSDYMDFKTSYRAYKGKIVCVSNSGEITVKSKQGYLENYRTGGVKISY